MINGTQIQLDSIDLNRLTPAARNSLVMIAGSTMSGPLILSEDPLNTMEAATKNYVDVRDSLQLYLTGGLMSGPLILNDNPTNPLGAATKQYVDNLTAPVSGKVNRAGDTMGGFLFLSADPVLPLHASTKYYVDHHVGGGMTGEGTGGTLAIWTGGAGSTDLSDSVIQQSSGNIVVSGGGTFTANTLISSGTGAGILLGTPSVIPAPGAGQSGIIYDSVNDVLKYYSRGTSSWEPIAAGAAGMSAHVVISSDNTALEFDHGVLVGVVALSSLSNVTGTVIVAGTPTMKIVNGVIVQEGSSSFSSYSSGSDTGETGPCTEYLNNPRVIWVDNNGVHTGWDAYNLCVEFRAWELENLFDMRFVLDLTPLGTFLGVPATSTSSGEPFPFTGDIPVDGVVFHYTSGILTGYSVVPQSSLSAKSQSSQSSQSQSSQSTKSCACCGHCADGDTGIWTVKDYLGNPLTLHFSHGSLIQVT